MGKTYKDKEMKEEKKMEKASKKAMPKPSKMMSGKSKKGC